MATLKSTGLTARQFIAEYLDPNNTLRESPTSREEAESLYDSMEETFEADGGCGMSLIAFLRAVAEIQVERGWPDWSNEIR